MWKLPSTNIKESHYWIGNVSTQTYSAKNEGKASLPIPRFGKCKQPANLTSKRNRPIQTFFPRLSLFLSRCLLVYNLIRITHNSKQIDQCRNLTRTKSRTEPQTSANGGMKQGSVVPSTQTRRIKLKPTHDDDGVWVCGTERKGQYICFPCNCKCKRCIRCAIAQPVPVWH